MLDLSNERLLVTLNIFIISSRYENIIDSLENTWCKIDPQFEYLTKKSSIERSKSSRGIGQRIIIRLIDKRSGWVEYVQLSR